MLQQEFETSQSEVEDTNAKYTNLRNRMQDIAQETLAHEREVRDLQNQLEQCRLDRDEWKRSAEKEKALVAETRAEVDHCLQIAMQPAEPPLLPPQLPEDAVCPSWQWSHNSRNLQDLAKSPLAANTSALACSVKPESKSPDCTSFRPAYAESCACCWGPHSFLAFIISDISCQSKGTGSKSATS